ncbi:MAG: hypothetical protein R3C44_04815, partial [Chloroflexota bacterium]
MAVSSRKSTTPDIHSLWAGLTESLLTIFDAHSVCATLAEEIAQFAGTRTAVCISDADHTHFDVWIATPDAGLEQLRWR